MFTNFASLHRSVAFERPLSRSRIDDKLNYYKGKPSTRNPKYLQKACDT